MSFILDALKKSETDRQRQSGPALFEVKVAPPKARFPIWAVAIVALLAVNMVIVGWLLLRRPSSADDTAVQTRPPNSLSEPTVSYPPPQAPSYPPPAATAPQQTAAPPNTAAGQSNIGTTLTIPPPGTAPVAQQQSPSQTPDDVQRPARLPDRDLNEPTLAGPKADANANPDDYAPATEEPSTSAFKGHVRRGTESGLMLYQDAAVAAGANLPPIRLDLHVYAEKPEDRFALINMHKLHEGDSIAGGVRVESITPDGVIMSHNGTKFLLPRD